MPRKASAAQDGWTWPGQNAEQGSSTRGADIDSDLSPPVVPVAAAWRAESTATPSPTRANSRALSTLGSSHRRLLFYGSASPRSTKASSSPAWGTSKVWRASSRASTRGKRASGWNGAMWKWNSSV